MSNTNTFISVLGKDNCYDVTVEGWVANNTFLPVVGVDIKVNQGINRNFNGIPNIVVRTIIFARGPSSIYFGQKIALLGPTFLYSMSVKGTCIITSFSIEGPLF